MGNDNMEKPETDAVAVGILWADRARHFGHYEKFDKKLDDILQKLINLPCEANNTRRVLIDLRVDTLEKQISIVKQGYWKACLTSAIVGGLVARLAPDILWRLIEGIFKAHGVNG